MYKSVRLWFVELTSIDALFLCEGKSFPNLKFFIQNTKNRDRKNKTRLSKKFSERIRDEFFYFCY